MAGRKRHILVDTGGLLLAARVHGADLHDRDGGRRLLAEDLRRELPRLELVWADGAYTGGFREWLEEERGWRMEVPRHRDRQLWRYGSEEKPRGFLLLPRRWVVERTFAWLGLSRRLKQGLRKVAGDRGGDDLRGDEPAHATQVSASSMKRSHLGFVFAKLPLGEVRVMRFTRTTRESCAQARAISGGPVHDTRPFTTSCQPAYASCMPVQANPGWSGSVRDTQKPLVYEGYRTPMDASGPSFSHS
jgi:transposase